MGSQSEASAPSAPDAALLQRVTRTYAAAQEHIAFGVGVVPAAVGLLAVGFVANVNPGLALAMLPSIVPVIVIGGWLTRRRYRRAGRVVAPTRVPASLGWVGLMLLGAALLSSVWRHRAFFVIDHGPSAAAIWGSWMVLLGLGLTLSLLFAPTGKALLEIGAVLLACGLMLPREPIDLESLAFILIVWSGLGSLTAFTVALVQHVRFAGAERELAAMAS